MSPICTAQESTKKRVSSAHGFTLIELIVVIAIMAMIVMGLVTGVRRISDKNLKQTAIRLSSTVRYLYDKAAMDGLYIRLVFDLGEEKQSYYVEASTDPVVVAKDDSEKKRDSDTDKDEKKAAAEEALEKGEGDSSKGDKYAIKPAAPKFGKVDSFLLKEVKLPAGVRIKDICVEHRKVPIDQGSEFIYFFPNGYVEYAIINITNKNNTVNFSVETNPATGKTNIKREYRSCEETK